MQGKQVEQEAKEQVLSASGLEWVSTFHGSIPGAFQAVFETFLRDRSSRQLRTHVGNIQTEAQLGSSSSILCAGSASVPVSDLTVCTQVRYQRSAQHVINLVTSPYFKFASANIKHVTHATSF